MKFIDYIQGLRKGKIARQIENDSMSDPFLADAIDGYDSVTGNHADHIARMQARISARVSSKKNKPGAWKIAIAATVLIALMGGYFTLMNHKSSMLVAQEQDNTYINLYAPEAYIERKSLELAEIKESGTNKKPGLNAVVNISNLDEVIKPADGLKIYIPGAYAQLRKDEIEELSRTKEKRTQEANKQNTIINENIAPPVPSAVLAEIPAPLNREVATSNEDLIASYADEQAETSVSNRLSGKTAGIRVVESKPAAKENIGMGIPEATSSSGKSFLSGKIVDKNNEPLIGVNVQQKGTTNGVITDIDGNYRIQVDSENPTLIANYLGYETIEIPKAKDNQTIALTESNKLLNEVVVSGYGIQKKADIASVVMSIDAKELKTAKTEPEPVIGKKEYKKYLESNIKRPANSSCNKEKGKVVLEFNINTLGRPVNITVTKSLCKDLDNEAIRLVESGPDWTYGTALVKVEVKF